MALVRCKECRKRISDQSSACIKCGAPRVPAPPREKASGSGLVKFLIAMALWAVLLNFPYGDLDTPAQAAPTGQAVPVAKAPPVKKPEKVVAASPSNNRAGSKSFVDEFIVNNMEEIRQAANRELCGHQDVPDFVGAVKVIMLMDRSSPSFRELSSREQSYFTQKFYTVGQSLLGEC